MTTEAWREANEHLPRRLANLVAAGRVSQQHVEETLAALAAMLSLIRQVSRADYAAFMEAARRLMPDPDDVPTLALAMAYGPDVAIWTNDRQHFWGCGVAVWITERLRVRLGMDD